MEHTANQITLRGSLHTLPEFSHENHGRRFFRFLLEVPRLSGAVDLLPVVAGEALVESLDPWGGEQVRVTGQLRSHNCRAEGVRRLMIFVFAGDLRAEDGPALNECSLEGRICREPVFRRTPLGREICDVMLAVPRAFRRADYLPCILWGRTAHQIAPCPPGTCLQLTGRFQNRGYTKLTQDGPQERTAYEISALTARELTEQAV